MVTVLKSSLLEYEVRQSQWLVEASRHRGVVPSLNGIMTCSRVSGAFAVSKHQDSLKEGLGCILLQQQSLVDLWMCNVGKLEFKS